MTKPTTKKVLLFLVEGPSDAAALEHVMQQLLDPAKIRFHALRADITAMRQPAGKSIKTAVNDVVCRFIKAYRLHPQDIAMVAHLMDTDGAFVPSSAVHGNSRLQGFRYTETDITGPTAQAVLDRNSTKSRQMLTLAGMAQTFRNIPYQALFCSRNLEHVLHNISRECTPEEKMALSDQFHDRFASCPQDFLRFISTVPPAVPVDGFTSSWQYISAPDSLHSLQRNCNLHILLHQLGEEMGRILP